MANHLDRDKQIAVVNALVEGCSIRSTERMTGVNRETIIPIPRLDDVHRYWVAPCLDAPAGFFELVA